MFLIANNTKKNIVLDDLGIVLSPKQAIDLSKLHILKIKPESSQDLKLAVSIGNVKILKRDPVPTPAPIVRIESPSSGVTKEEITSIIRKELSQIKSPRADDTEVLRAINELKSNLNILAEKGIITAQEAKEISADPDISVEKLIEIHAKATAKLTENTQGSIAHDKQTITADSQIVQNASELEKLL